MQDPALSTDSQYQPPESHATATAKSWSLCFFPYLVPSASAEDPLRASASGRRLFLVVCIFAQFGRNNGFAIRTWEIPAHEGLDSRQRG